jgi:[acyl-carrier-protein] S-malonyltransferase
MSDRNVILCPGQGAQSVGMGRDWFEASPEAAQTFGSADEILGDRLPDKLSKLCFEGPEEILNRTDVAQPAIFVCSVAAHQAMFAGGSADTLAATAGLSLGEYTALHLAGVMSFSDALELVALRGRAMQDAAEASESSMVALTGADEEQARAVCDRAGDGEPLVCANFNAPGQVVISGAKSACERALSVAQEMGLRATALAVAGAFHSPFMAPAAERLGKALAEVDLSAPRCPVLSNVTGRPHGEEEREGDEADAIRRLLVEQLTSPVRWSDCCRWLVGHVSGEGVAYHELAPGRVLAGLMRRIDRGTKVVSHDAPSS